MSTLTLWLVIIGMGVITYGLRLSMIVFLGRVQLPAGLRRALRFVPSAVLSAIILPELLVPGGVPTPWNPRLVAGAVAALVAWRTRNVLAAIASGMGALWMLQTIW